MEEISRPPKRVLHVIHGLGAGGAETWLLNTVRYLTTHPEINLHFDFLATGGEVCLFDKEIEALGAKVFYVRYSLKRSFQFSRQFRSILQSHHYDAIHDHQDFVSGWHFLLGLGYLPPIRISHLHNPFNFVSNYISSTSRWISYKIGRLLTVLFTTKITGTSNAVMDEYGYDGWPYKIKRVDPIYCGFDTEEFKFNAKAKNEICHEFGWETPACKIALFIGRLTSADRGNIQNQKNPEFAFEVARLLVSGSQNWKFIFAGQKGTLGEDMERETIQQGMEREIKFLGVRRDIPMLLSAADILVFPSLWEGLGMVAVEAQASGLPVILSNAVPAEAIVCDELVTSKSLKDGVSEWVATIEKLAEQSVPERYVYAKEVSNSVFSIESSLRNLLHIYS